MQTRLFVAIHRKQYNLKPCIELQKQKKAPYVWGSHNLMVYLTIRPVALEGEGANDLF